LTAITIGPAIVMLGVGSINVLFVPFVYRELGTPLVLAGVIEGSMLIAMLLGSALAPILVARITPERTLWSALLVCGGLLLLWGGVAELWGVTEGASLLSMAGAGTVAALIGMRGTFVAAGVLCLFGGLVTAILVTGAVRERVRTTGDLEGDRGGL